MKQALKLGVGLAISGICLWLVFRRVPLDQLWSAIASIPARILAAGFAIGTTTLLLRAIRWRILLAARTQLTLRSAFEVNSAGQLGNFVLPARAGDFYRATSLNRAGLNTAFTLATVFVERILDTGFLVLIAASILIRYPAASPWLARGARLLAIAAVAGLCITFFLPRFESQLRSLTLRFAPLNWRARADHLLNQFLDGLRSFQHFGRASSFILLTAVIWTLDSSAIAIVAGGLGFSLSPVTAALLICAIALSSAVPSAPGGIGVNQLVAVSVLATAGIPREPALSLALIIQFSNILILSFWGLLGFWSLNVRAKSRNDAYALNWS